jgi:hypothetical protein
MNAVNAVAAASGLQRYFLHATAKVTAEHHVLLQGENGKPQNLLSPGMELWNKWEAEHHNRSWVQIEFAGPLVFHGIGFRSAGDHPRKSPTECRIFVYHALNGGWNEIGFRVLEFGLKPFTLLEFPELHGETRMVRFEFHNNRNVKGVQLAEIIFYHREGVAAQVAVEAVRPAPVVVVE